ncbi:uncharacterized protein LOC130713587 isoform X2 [Lotus japonicus]|uniref:uncharacterized protein LOC130713587 isoform X2 n=1 Tax=Lotus japonicus TaxID=34305 RepID=UPI00258BD2B2|nr:uncharacterized protein LOC130713587 isoform X2 [Lotus japonicus]
MQAFRHFQHSGIKPLNALFLKKQRPFISMEERGESSASASAIPSDQIWAKLVPSDSRYSDIVIWSDVTGICSEISATPSVKRCWCKIARNSDLCSATMENTSPNTILVDGAVVCNDETIAIKDGSEIISGSDKGYVSYRFHIMSSPETCQRELKICVDVENTKCSICLNIWHDVVTTGPCLHNFCNGCFSEWSRRSQAKCSIVLCPQCRAVVQFVKRNPFLRTIAEDIVRADSSLRRSDEEIALLDTHASVHTNFAEGVPGAEPLSEYRVEYDSEEETDSDDQDDDDDEEETDSFDQGDEEETDSSLSHSDEEIALLDTHASAEGVPVAQPAEEQPIPPPPTTSMSQLLQELQKLRANSDHTCLQQAAIYRASCAIYECHYRSSLQQGSPSPYCWPTPEDFAARVAWPGDRPTFEEGVSSHGAGPVHRDQAKGSGGDEEEETHSEDQDNEKEETDSED